MTAVYIHQANIQISSIEEAYELCESTEGFSLISLNSYEEQQLLQYIYNVLIPYCSKSTIYAFISLKEVIILCACINKYNLYLTIPTLSEKKT